jgi:hypothetical protein
MQPTRIIAPPETRKNAGSSRPYRVYLLDDGEEYTLQEMSAATGIVPSTLSNRLGRHGWGYEHIFKNVGSGKPLPSGMLRNDNKEWAALGVRPRTRNLMKIRQPGSFERQYLEENPSPVSGRRRGRCNSQEQF